jgi:hypothetical protein
MKGASEMIAQIRKVAREYPDRVKSALYQEAQIEMTESKKRCPVDTGILRASGFVAEPEVDGENISVTLSYGGAAVDYAIPVHENLEAFHPVGEAKFLESVLNESAPHMAERLARRLHLDGEK